MTKLALQPKQPKNQVRALGLDLGTKRVGVAVSDSDGLIATPIEVVKRLGDISKEHLAIEALVKEWEVDVVVVGVPYSLDGSIGPMAKKALIEVKKLGNTLAVPVEICDERLTTVTAERSLREQGITSKDGRKVVDQLAASILLQAWLDSRRNSED